MKERCGWERVGLYLQEEGVGLRGVHGAKEGRGVYLQAMLQKATTDAAATALEERRLVIKLVFSCQSLYLCEWLCNVFNRKALYPSFDAVQEDLEQHGFRWWEQWYTIESGHHACIEMGHL